MATVQGFTQQAPLHTYYELTIQWRGELFGGIPKDPKVIEGWLKSGKLKLQDEEEYRRLLVSHLQDLGHEISPDLRGEALDEAVARLAGDKNTQGFKADPSTGQFYIESRYINSALREAVNILYAGERWGPTKKSPKDFFVEHISLPAERALLMREDGTPVREPDEVRPWIGHIPDRFRGGTTGTLGYHEILVRPKTVVLLAVLEDVGRGGKELTPERWWRILGEVEENGIGAKRSQNYGKCNIEMRRA